MKLNRNTLLLTSLGLTSFLIFLISQFPAALAYAWFGQRLPAQVYGMTGTVWSGQATTVIYDDARLQALRWDLHPSRLVLGRIAGDLQARVPEGLIRGHISAGRNSLRGRDIRVEMPVNVLLELANLQVPAQLGGTIDIAVPEVAARDGRVEEILGMIGWHQASINLGQPLSLGRLDLRVESADDGSITGQLLGRDGPIDLNGKLRVAPDGEFTLDMEVRASGQPEEAARQAMNMLGIPTDGSPTYARLSGNIDGSNVLLTPITQQQYES